MGPWPWPCLRAIAMPTDPTGQARSSVEEKERDWPASIFLLTTPFTQRHEPRALTSGRLADSHGSAKKYNISNETMKKIMFGTNGKTIKETETNIHANQNK